MKKRLYKSKKHWVVAGVATLAFTGTQYVAADSHVLSADFEQESTRDLLTDDGIEEPTTVKESQSVIDSDSHNTQSASTSLLDESSVERQVLHQEPTVRQAVSETAAAPLRQTRSVASSSEAGSRVLASNPPTTRPLVDTQVTNQQLVLQYNGDTAHYDKVHFAVWNDKQGQNDLKWYEADRNGRARAAITQHEGYGTYHVHTYANQANRLIGLNAKTVSVKAPVFTSSPSKVATTITALADGRYGIQVAGVPVTMRQVLIPVWSEKNGQDDIVWYPAKQIAQDRYAAQVAIANHKGDTGLYHAHVYGRGADNKLVGLAASRFIHRLEESKDTLSAAVAISQKTATTATVTVTQKGKPISGIRVAAWSKTNGQDDLKWYQASPVGQKASVTVNMRDLSNTTDYYSIHVYTDYQDGTTKGVNLGDHAFVRPQIKEDLTAQTSRDGILIALKSDAITDYKQVRFAVWSDNKGQDDLRWYAADSNGRALADFAHHPDSGKYHIHAYSVASGRAVGIMARAFTITDRPEKTGAVTLSAVNPRDYTFTATVRNASAKEGIKSVQLAVWSDKNGQDDLRWYLASKNTDGTYTAKIHLANHQFTGGKYHVHTYYTLTNGRQIGLAAGELNNPLAAPKTVFGTGSASQGQYGILNKIIYLDAGHGGHDSGASYYGTHEKTLNLSLQNLIKSRLENAGYRVLTTRDKDTHTDLLPRSSKANNSLADLFVSIHFNASTNAAAHGIETYYYQYYPDYQPQLNKTYHNSKERLDRSAFLANAIQTNLVQKTGAKNNGVRRNTFAVLRETTAPSVLLELGYLSNAAEHSRLIQASYQDKLASGVVDGILNYYKTFTL